MNVLSTAVQRRSIIIRAANGGVKKNVACYNAPSKVQGSNVGKPGNTGIRRVIRAARYSVQGLAHGWKHEAAFRQEVMLTIVMLPLAIWLGRTALEQFLLIASCFFVLVVELLNSAIEAVVDRVGKESHELAGRAKDMGSAAVFLSLLIVGAYWGFVAWQRFV